MKLMQDIACKKLRGILSDELLPEEECRDPGVQRVLNRVNIGISIAVTIGSMPNLFYDLITFGVRLITDCSRRAGRVSSGDACRSNWSRACPRGKRL